MFVSDIPDFYFAIKVKPDVFFVIEEVHQFKVDLGLKMMKILSQDLTERSTRTAKMV